MYIFILNNHEQLSYRQNCSYKKQCFKPIFFSCHWFFIFFAFCRCLYRIWNLQNLVRPLLNHSVLAVNLSLSIYPYETCRNIQETWHHYLYFKVCWPSGKHLHAKMNNYILQAGTSLFDIYVKKFMLFMLADK